MAGDQNKRRASYQLPPLFLSNFNQSQNLQINFSRNPKNEILQNSEGCQSPRLMPTGRWRDTTKLGADFRNSFVEALNTFYATEKHYTLRRDTVYSVRNLPLFRRNTTISLQNTDDFYLQYLSFCKSTRFRIPCFYFVISRLRAHTNSNFHSY